MNTPNLPTQRPQGRFGKALARLLMKQALIVETETIAEGFRLITLESPEFKDVHWIPGQKLQVAMGSAFIMRTFTPIEWDARAGRTRILGYTHGAGPGSAWVSDSKPGDSCDVLGPRTSLDMHRVSGIPVVFGDETSLGLVCALSHHASVKRWDCLLEVNHVFHVREVLARLGLEHSELFERTGNDAHLADIERRLPNLDAAGATFILTGNAPSIQRLHRTLKASGVPVSRRMVKPYWAPGKTGLD